MECNKEEALRAKEIAEKKMSTNDFEAARKVALKAQRLYPELENIVQLLTVCDVHCSAHNYINGSDKDWYGILQLEKLADEVAVKKQYRKLALLLHPDKNKFPGAEAAFKLIGEANMVLSDSGKRSLYDSKLKISARMASAKAPPHQVNRNVSARQNVAQNNSTSKFSNLPQHQKPHSAPSVGQEAFWTCCPFCSIKYQYYREFVNRALRCQKCDKPFIAYDVGAQGMGPRFSSNPPVFQQNIPEHGTSRAGFQRNEARAQEATANFSSHPTVSRETVFPDQVSKKMKAKDGSSRMTSGNCRTEQGTVHKAGAEKPKESGERGNRSRKRGRKQQVKSSESHESSSSEETEDFNVEENGNTVVEDSGLNNCQTRRSFRKRRHVSYDEGAIDGDNDTQSAPKNSRGSKSSGDVANIPKAANAETKVKENGSIPHQESLSEGVAGKQQVRGAEKVKVLVDSESDTEPEQVLEPQTFTCPDPEFNDFEKCKERSCFEVGQIWACYDTADGMPRFHALIKRVFQSEFSLEITWLEPISSVYKEKQWIEEELPVGCGRFKRGSTENTSNLLSFSHKVDFVRVNQSTYAIYPKKGQIWALFKDWDIGWSSNPDDHRQYEYEIVEVLSNYDKSLGIEVAYLDKVQGFVSLFQRSQLDSFVIEHSDLLRFSHQIPCFGMAGSERKGVPEGSFELDPASLLINGSSCPEDDNSGIPGEGHSSFPKSKDTGKEKMSNVASPRRSVNSRGKC